jgi:hypothetical protein
MFADGVFLLISKYLQSQPLKSQTILKSLSDVLSIRHEIRQTITPEMFFQERNGAHFEHLLH